MTTEMESSGRRFESDRRFRTIFDAAAIGIAVIDMTGRIIETNPALHDMLGYSADDLRAMTLSELTHEPDLDADVAVMGELLAGRRDSYRVEKRYVRKDGKVVWGRLAASLVRDDDGTPRYAIAMVEDITQHKELEAQFPQAQKMEAVGRLASGVAHDFNNLLTVIRGYSEFIIGRSKDQDARRDDAVEIKEAAQRASILAHQLLGFSRKRVRHPQVLDVNRVVRDVETMLARLIGEDVNLLLRMADGPCATLADPVQLQQVLMNLAVNARDAMPAGGTLVIETAEEVVTTGRGANACNDSGRHVRISVTDTGEGIPDSVRPHIFEPFFTTKEAEKGSGLGLSTVDGIVTQSGGFMRVRSEVGRGSTFDVLLPCVRGSAASETPVEPAPVPVGFETILLVEDDPAVRRFARRALVEVGYSVLDADGGPEALRIAETHDGRIDAIVTDVVMPGMTGVTLVARIERTRPDIRVLYVSGYADHTMEQHGVFEDRLRFLRKPFTQGELARALREALA